MSISLLKEIRACTACKDFLPYAPKPVLNFSKKSKIVIIGQAPGLKVQQSGIPWNDASGDRLREWLGVTVDEFYDPNNFAIIPMGFCYPGNNGNGDLPPRRECAELWVQKIIKTLKHKELVLLVGQYSQQYFLKDTKKKTLTETVKNYKDYLPEYFALPHPSPRNNIWFKKNSWFVKRNLPVLKKEISTIIK